MKRNSINLLLASATMCTLAACGGGSKGSPSNSGGSSGVGTASTQALTPSQKAACAAGLSSFKDAQQTSESDLALTTVSGKIITSTCGENATTTDGVIRKPLAWGDVKLNVVNGVPTATEGKFVEIFNADTCERFGVEVDQLNTPPVISKYMPGVKGEIGQLLKSVPSIVGRFAKGFVGRETSTEQNLNAIIRNIKETPVHAYMTDGSIQAKFAIGSSDGITVREGYNRLYFRYYKNCLPNGDYKSAPEGKFCDNPGEVKSGSVVLNVKHNQVVQSEPAVNDPCGG